MGLVETMQLHRTFELLYLIITVQKTFNSKKCSKCKMYAIP